MKHLHLQGRRVEYRDVPASNPDRPPLVLLHEGLGSASMWGRFPEKLAAATGCRVLAASRAGYGHSDPTTHERTPAYHRVEVEGDLPAFLDALELERPVLVGHSDGGTIALLFGATHPTRARGLVAMAPHEFIEEVTLAGIRETGQLWRSTDLRERLARHHADPDRVFREWHDVWLSAPYRDWTMEAELSAITCPVLAIQGLEDQYGSLRQIEVIAERAPQTRLLVLPDCGHSPHRDQEALVLEAIGAFLREI